MDFLKGKIRPLYFKYLTAAFCSALIASIYGIADMAMVGQYQGPQGTAAMAVISPIWNIIYSLGLLMGNGGSVLLSTLRGESEKNLDRSNEYFTAAIIGVSILALITSRRCSSQDVLHRLRRARRGPQRHPHLPAAGRGGPGLHLGCHAGHGGPHGGLCGLDDDPIYEENRRRVRRIAARRGTHNRGMREAGRRLKKRAETRYNTIK